MSGISFSALCLLVSPFGYVRISHLEMLDEIEELELVLAHYAITWGVKLPSNTSALKAQWREWGIRRKMFS